MFIKRDNYSGGTKTEIGEQGARRRAPACGKLRNRYLLAQGHVDVAVEHG
jgi:hypothetical protein